MEMMEAIKESATRDERGKKKCSEVDSNEEDDGGDSRRNLSQARIEMTGRKVELPTFTGENPLAWTFRAERYFSVKKTSAEDKVAIAAVSFEGEAINWFQWYELRRPFRTWQKLKEALLSRFKTDEDESGFLPLLNLRQEGTVKNYIAQFELCSGYLPQASEELLMDCYMNGLKREIRAEMLMNRVNRLDLLMEQSLLAEKELGMV